MKQALGVLFTSWLTLAALLLLPCASFPVPGDGEEPTFDPTPGTSSPLMPPNSGPLPERTITWVMDTWEQTSDAAYPWGENGRLLYPAHSYLEFGQTSQSPGDAGDGPCRVALLPNRYRDNGKVWDDQYFIRVLTQRPQFPPAPIPAHTTRGVTRRVFVLPLRTTKTNRELLDPRDGGGALHLAWFADARSRWEVNGQIDMPLRFYDGNSFLLEFLRNPNMFGLGLRFPNSDELERRIESAVLWARTHYDRQSQTAFRHGGKVPIVSLQLDMVTPDSNLAYRRDFRLANWDDDFRVRTASPMPSDWVVTYNDFDRLMEGFFKLKWPFWAVPPQYKTQRALLDPIRLDGPGSSRVPPAEIPRPSEEELNRFIDSLLADPAPKRGPPTAAPGSHDSLPPQPGAPAAAPPALPASRLLT